MNVTSAQRLESLRSAYSEASTRATTARQEMDTAQIEMNQQAATADKLANKINRWVWVRNKMPYVGMGSFMAGMSSVQIGVSLHSPLLMGMGLVGLATCAACIVGIETWKVRGPRMRAQHDQLLSRFNGQMGAYQAKASAFTVAQTALTTAEQALRKEEESIEELKRLLKPPALGGISEQVASVTVGGVRLPKRPNPDKKSLF